MLREPGIRDGEGMAGKAFEMFLKGGEGGLGGEPRRERRPKG